MSLLSTLRSWVVQSSGYAESKVIWSNQQGLKPANPCITMMISSLLPTGREHISEEYNDDTDVVDRTVHGHKEGTCIIQVFDDDVVNVAYEIACKMQTSLELDYIVELFKAAEVSVFDHGDVKVASAIQGTDFEGRAILTVRFYANLPVTEAVTYISTIVIDGLSQQVIVTE